MPREILSDPKDCAHLIHESVLAYGTKNIITLNFERTLIEFGGGTNSHVSSPSSRSYRSQKPVEETKYSIFRRYAPPEKTDQAMTFIWQIHGDTSKPTTLMLGYEHYCGQLAKLRSHYKADIQNAKNHERAPILYGDPMSCSDSALQQWIDEPPHALKHGDNRVNKFRSFGWPDIFLRDETHILGAGMPFIELTLWWLISIRSRLISKCGMKQRFGQIYYWEFGEKPLRSKGDEHAAKHEALMRLGVSVVDLRNKEKNPYFSQRSSALETIKERTG